MSCIIAPDRIRNPLEPPAPPFLEPTAHPAPGSPAELHRFAMLQRRLAPMFRRVFADPVAPRTVVVVPSLTLDRAELAKLRGASFYEERLLCLLMLLRLPATRLVYVTSRPVSNAIVQYYLRHLPSAAAADASGRLTMLSCHDRSASSLTEKILDDDAIVSAIRSQLNDPAASHLTCFNATALERTLAVRLGIPLYGCDPALSRLGTKSGSRTVFRKAGVVFPPGFEHLRDTSDVIDALVALKRADPRLRRAVIKLEDGFSGEGNAIFPYEGAPDGPALHDWVRGELSRRARCVAPDQRWEEYAAEFDRMGGVVEAFVDGGDGRSPSVQCRIDPLGGIQIISSHDQLLGGASGQIYMGCAFPAMAAASPALNDAALRIAAVLRDEGALGRFGIDFVSRGAGTEATHVAIEINLRKGGTTHPYLMLQHLTDGAYDASSGSFRTAAGRERCYVASDNLCNPAYTNLSEHEVMEELPRSHGLQFDRAAQRGVVFHMIGALREYGKLGAVSIAGSHDEARRMFDRAVAMLDRRAERHRNAIHPLGRISSSNGG